MYSPAMDTPRQYGFLIYSIQRTRRGTGTSIISRTRNSGIGERVSVRRLRRRLGRRCRGRAEGAFHHVIRIGRDGLIAPKPAHHAWENGASLLLAVIADSPGVIQIIPFFRQRLHQAHILVEPVFVVIFRRPAIVVSSVLHEKPDGLFF